MNDFGLSEEQFDLLYETFASISEIEAVYVFGSRARGDYTKTSDLDLAVKFQKGTNASIAGTSSKLDDLPIIYKFDVVDLNNIKDEFQEDVNKDKTIFYRKGRRWTTLGEVAEIISGGTPSTKNPKFWNGKIPWISVKDIVGATRHIESTEKTITSLGLDHSATALLLPGDTIISARGTVGEIAQIGKEMAFNQSCYGLRAKECMDPDYLYYLLKTKAAELQRGVHGAVFDTITRTSFDYVSFLLPPLEEQRLIAAVLSSLDNKIELLREENKTLESIAQTLFKEWFVDFNFPNKDGKPYKKSGGEMVDSELGKIPRGWGVGSLIDIADFLNGLALQKYPPKEGGKKLPVIKIREMKQGVSETSDYASNDVVAEYVVCAGDVLFSWSGSLDVVIWDGVDGALNQHLFKVSSDKFPKWFYYQWLLQWLPEFRLIAGTKATTMGHIQRYHLQDAFLSIPNTEFLDIYGTVLDGLMNKIECGDQESRRTGEIRNRILPHLIGGELFV